MWSFCNPVQLHFGWNITEKLPELLPPGKAFIVSGGTSTKKLFEKISGLLHARDFVLFDRVEANPSAETAEQGIALCKEEKCEFVLGLGGGSPLDCAKAIAFLVRQKAGVLDVMHKREEPKQPGLPFYAVPTTAGTGSEVTQYSILTDVARKKKISITSVLSFPKAAIVDPFLTVSMPPSVTASTGLDVLAHAVESAWSRFSNPVSQSFAIAAVRGVFTHLETAVQDGGNRQAREGMMLASVLAGLAISGTGTTINHSISYPLTLCKGLAHGFACAISLPAVMRYNLNAARETLTILAQGSGLKDAEGLIERVETLMRSVQAPLRLSGLDLKEGDLDWLAEESFGKNVARNPEKMEKSDMRELLQQML